MNTYGKDSAQLEREVEEQRQRIENRIGEIRERLSPGQIVDELLSYSKNGGQQFASNLGHTIAANPLPAALLGVSLAWLMSGQGPKLMSTGNGTRYRPSRHEPEYPYATVSGGLKRVQHSADEAGHWYSEFADTAGKRYRAQATQTGHRIGHFVDDTGRRIGGFIDEAGHRVRDFQDEAGNRMEDAAGWASHAWHDVQQAVSETMGHVTDQARHMGASAQQQMDRTNRMILDQYQAQPLVAGALAFAIGAALGAALPHTRQEDEAVGRMADKVRAKATEAASDVYEEGKVRAAELYEKGKEGAADAYNKLTKSGAGTEDTKSSAYH